MHMQVLHSSEGVDQSEGWAPICMNEHRGAQLQHVERGSLSSPEGNKGESHNIKNRYHYLAWPEVASDGGVHLAV